MKRLRILAVSFDTHLDPWELTRFRGAVAHKVGLEHEWFHNHDNETGGYHQRYPLIQYKLETRGAQQRPMLLCLDQGIEEAHHFFSQSDWSLRIGERQHEMRIANLDVRQYTLNEWPEQQFVYRLHKWQAFNQDNYAEWKRLESLAERYRFLEETLASHILSFARGVDWQIERRFEVRITNLLREEWISYKNIKRLCFSLEFKTTLSLPDWIGLGKGGASGFGVIRRQETQKPIQFQ